MPAPTINKGRRQKAIESRSVSPANRPVMASTRNAMGLPPPNIDMPYSAAKSKRLRGEAVYHG